MIAFRNDHKKYNFDSSLNSILPLKFIFRYGCIPYTKVENSILILVKREFDIFNVTKINFFIEENIDIEFISYEEWNELYDLLSLSSQKTAAINKYEFESKNNEKQLIIKDEVNKFYQAEVENAPIVKIVDSIISEAIVLKSSDIHFEPMEKCIRIRLRIDGKLLEKTNLPISSLEEIVSRIKVIANLDITKKLIPQDGKIRYKYEDFDYDLRVSILPTIYGERIVLRILDLNKGAYKLNELGFSNIAYGKIVKLNNESSGLILVVGPTGSGKSTSLQAFLTSNIEKNVNIITVEDPVEYSIIGASQIQVNDESGLTFANCLRSILRQDPNIIMIGEIRDTETAKIACRAAITGHLVYSTLHTNTSMGVISRLLDMDVEPYLLVDALKGIISQRLVRCLCPSCRKKVTISDAEAKYLGVDLGSKIYKSKGCPKCNMTGYKGRQGIYEVVMIDDDFRELIINKAPISKYWKLFSKKQNESIFENGKNLILKGITSIEELSSIIDD